MTKASVTENKRLSSFIHFATLMFHCGVLFLILIIPFFGVGDANAQSIIKELPGYSGNLPFKLETGYIGVGEADEIQLFYYFVESERTPSEDPVLMWLTGGPGCSCLFAFFYESGPLRFKYVNYNGSLPTLIKNPYRWTKAINMLYVDAPVGTGFSYSTTANGYYNDDYVSSTMSYQFLRKFLTYHPQFSENNLYVGGDSYSGKMVPMIVNKVVNSNAEGLRPLLNLQGYIIGNPVTDSNIDDNSRIKFAHQMTLISDALYESAKSSCNGIYVNVNPENAKCIYDLAAIDELLRDINEEHVLEPDCSLFVPESDEDHRRSLFEDLRVPPTSQESIYWCRSYGYVLSSNWANNDLVQKALHVREGTKTSWERCNGSLSYTENVDSVVAYHRNLSATTSLRALVLSGDHDMSVPHIGTQTWINSLNMTIFDTWRAWSVDGQVAGYTIKYTTDSDYSMVFATIKGAGHIAPEYKPKQVSTLIKRWLAFYPV